MSNEKMRKVLERALPFIAFAYSTGIAGAEELGREIELALAEQSAQSDRVPTEQWISDALLRIKNERGQCGVHETAAALRQAMLAAAPEPPK